MNQQWYEPLKLSEWFRRVFSILNLSIFFFTAIFLFSEFRFDWCEKIVGSYLSSTNKLRPEIGSIWKAGKQTSNANKFLLDIVNKKQHQKLIIENSFSFLQLAQQITPGEWESIEKEHFKNLYLSLPEPVAHKFISPAKLLWILNKGNLNRIFCARKDDGLFIYFLDSDNKVIQQIEFSKSDLEAIKNWDHNFQGPLEDFEEFSQRIYSADTFFSVLLNLPEEMIPDLIVNPELLLNEEGIITRVGISDEAKAGYINIGFEYEHKTQKKVIFAKGREWAVWQLTLNLKGT